ncbi:MAG: hypothetical protein OXF28_02040 [Thaumarchaeota archaeon]|nr:hypothetical protein [Nitrososphaerota archaeon]MCY3975897.1 hypothetical protein [Nitrososphaerota archaeon]
MASKQISLYTSIPMMLVGFIVVLLSTPEVSMHDTIEFVGYLIGITGCIFFIAGLFYKHE